MENLFKLGEFIQKVYFLCKKYGISIQSHEILSDLNSIQLNNEKLNVFNSNFKTAILNNYFCLTFEIEEDSKIDLKKIQ